MTVLRFSIAAAIVVASTWTLSPSTAKAQSPVLMDLYGRGVHAYYGGRQQEAYNLLSMAVTNGLEDPRAYYFLGIVADARGSKYEAEANWTKGAQLEAEGKIIGSVGRALARYQGHARLRLEKVRRKAKLDYLAIAASKSKQRYGEITDAGVDMLQTKPLPSGTVAAPPTPPAATVDPFASNGAGEAKVQSDDAFEGVMEDPFADEVTPNTSAPAGGGNDPFSSPAAGNDPFGGPDPAPAPGGDDPFGTGGGSSDPFGGAGDDPFGG